MHRWGDFGLYYILLSVSGEKIAELIRSLVQYLYPWQINHSEVVGFLPVESSAVNNQYLLFSQKVEGKLFVVGDVEFLYINLRESIKGSLWLFYAYSGDTVECILHTLSLLVDSAAGQKVLVDTLVASESGLHY